MQKDVFFWEDYLILNADIINHKNEKGALLHYENHGKKENRLINFANITKNEFDYNYNDNDELNNFKNIIYDKYGLNIDMTTKIHNMYSDEFFYLCNKYKIIEKTHKNILFYVLNNNYKDDKTDVKNDFELIISLYNENSLDRIFELLFVFSMNLQNKNIKKIHILFENNSTQKNTLIRTVINTILIRNKLYDKLIIVNIKTKPSFTYIFNYTNQLKGNTMISNSDIVFDNTLEQIGKKLQREQIICLSRHNWDKTMKSWNLIYMEFNGNKYTNIFSHDTWIFKSPMKFPINIDICLGDMFSDSYLNFKLTQFNNYSCFNLAKSVHAYHVQDNDSFSQIVKDNPELLNELLEKIKQKEYGNNDVLFGIRYTTINDLNNSHKNKFVSNLYFQQHTSEFLC